MDGQGPPSGPDRVFYGGHELAFTPSHLPDTDLQDTVQNALDNQEASTASQQSNDLNAFTLVSVPNASANDRDASSQLFNDSDADAVIATSDSANISNDSLTSSVRDGSVQDNTITVPASHSTTMAAPFEVPRSWQMAMSMVSINAALTPQAVLYQYYRTYTQHGPQQAGYVDLDLRSSRRDRGIKSVRICYRDNDPGKIQLMIIFCDEIDATTNELIRRLVTNTSVRHVLEDTGADCPLWLPVRKIGNDDSTLNLSPYQIIPCCARWADAVDFDRPLSSEEKQVPAVVDELINVVQSKGQLLLTKEAELQMKDHEIQVLKKLHQDKMQKYSNERVAVPMVPATAVQLPVFDAEILAQYWWALGLVVVFLTILTFK